VTSQSLATSYLRKARSRLKILEVLRADAAFSDVIREAQEIVELAMKGMLRHVGVEPPKWHDVGALMRGHRERFPQLTEPDLERLIRSSAWLRKEREFAFYGDIDFIPTEQYAEADAVRAIDDAGFVVEAAARIIIEVKPAKGLLP
jgi:HEPN domain-containing protein